MAFALHIAGADLCDYALADARVTIGRAQVSEQPSAGTLTATLLSTSAATAGSARISVADRVTLSSADVAAPQAAVLAGAAPDGWALFSGWITDIEAVQTADGLWATRVTAAGPLSTLARTPLTQAFPQQTDSQRIAAVLDAAGWDSSRIPIGVAGPQLLAHEAEQESSVADLLRAAADSGQGNLYEDHARGGMGYQPREYRTVAEIVARWDGLLGSWDDYASTAWDEAAPEVPAAYLLPCHAIYADSVQWVARTADVTTYAEILYGVAPEDSDRPMAVHGSLVPPVYGTRLDTLLVEASEAQLLADRLVAQRQPGRYTASGTLLDTAYLTSSELDALPDWLWAGGRVLLQLPAGSPYSQLEGFLEGWQHEITAQPDGISWTIILNISDWTLSAPATVWDDMQGSWDDYTEPWNTPIFD